LLFCFFFFFFLVLPFAAVFLHCTSSPANCLETDVEQFWIIIGGTLQAMEFVDAKEDVWACFTDPYKPL
jgi:hypothetical protein